MRTAVVNPSFAPSIKASYTLSFFLIPARINITIISISKILATDLLTTFICALSICANPHIIPATTADIPPKVRSIVRFKRLMRWYIDVTTMPANVEKNVASNIGTNISVGCAAPICARYTIMETGINVRPDVLSTRNIIIGFVAVSFLVLSSCNCSIALRPSGVAALSNPSILAATFMKILPVTGCPFGISGNRRVNTGDSTFANTFTTPPFSPIFIIPSHKDSTPVSPSDISNAALDESNVEFIIAGNTSTSPINTNRTVAMTKAMRKKAIQM